MKATDLRRFGRSGLEVTALGFGGGTLGNIFKAMTETEAQALVDAAWDAGIRMFDTAPMYGHGLSEARFGHALRWRPRADYVLSTKVGRLLAPAPRAAVDFSIWDQGLPFEIVYDYSYDGTMRSFENSLQRLGLERIDILWVHDCDVTTHGPEAQKARFRETMEGAWPALENLRDQGAVASIGLGVNEWQVCQQALEEHDFDSFLLAGRYTLLEQDALDSFLPMCAARDVAVAVGGGFNSGILATGAVPGARYNYAPAPEPILERVRRIEAICGAHGTPLPAAALQFLLAHPCVPTVPAGVRTPTQLARNIAWIEHPIPVDLWAELKHEGLLRADAPVPA